MNAPNAPVVAGIDGSEASLRAARWAAGEAARHEHPLRLVYAAGFPDFYASATIPLPQRLANELRQQGRRELRRAKDSVERVAHVEPQVQFVLDPPIPFLINQSKTTTMLVLGSSGRGGFAGMLLGSTAMSVANHAHCPVVIVRGDIEDAAHHRRPVVVGVDGSPISETAIAYAFDEAAFRNVDLVAIHTWMDQDITTGLTALEHFADWEAMETSAQRLLAERLAGWQEKYPDVHVHRTVARERPRHLLLRQSEAAQLIVVGSHGRSDFQSLLLGSVSRALIHHSKCPVMIARASKEKP